MVKPKRRSAGSTVFDMIAVATAAIANGGYLMAPYVVELLPRPAEDPQHDASEVRIDECPDRQCERALLLLGGLLAEPYRDLPGK